MRILIDECLDWRLCRALPGHFCASVQRMGWSGITNGELLRLMTSERFELFITGDRNLEFQQNVAHAKLAVVVLAAPSTRLVHTLPLMDSLLAIIGALEPGTVTVLSPPRRHP